MTCIQVSSCTILTCERCSTNTLSLNLEPYKLNTASWVVPARSETLKELAETEPSLHKPTSQPPLKPLSDIGRSSIDDISFKSYYIPRDTVYEPPASHASCILYLIHSRIYLYILG